MAKHVNLIHYFSTSNHFMVIIVVLQDSQNKVKKKRIKICFSKDISSDKGFSSSTGDNYAGGSNANIREETEFSTSNIEDKSHAGTELTNVSDEMTTTNADEVSKSQGDG